MAPIDPHTIRLTTVCVYSLCLCYRTNVPPHNPLSGAASQPDASSSFIVLSAAFLILFFVSILVLVLWELVRHFYSYASTLPSSSRRTATTTTTDDDGYGLSASESAAGCTVVTTDGAKVLSLYEHLDCVSPLCVMQHDGDSDRGHGWREEQHKKTDEDEEDEEDEEEQTTCAICLDPVRRRDITRRLSCKHQFHARCMDRWFLQEAVRSRPHNGCMTVRCPLCTLHVVRVPLH